MDNVKMRVKNNIIIVRAIIKMKKKKSTEYHKFSCYKSMNEIKKIE